jgi:hypothetical protein
VSKHGCKRLNLVLQNAYTEINIRPKRFCYKEKSEGVTPWLTATAKGKRGKGTDASQI